MPDRVPAPPPDSSDSIAEAKPLDGFLRVPGRRLDRVLRRVPRKWRDIEDQVLNRGTVPYGWAAAGMDERAVEYPWICDRMAELDAAGGEGRILDAGSILNHKRVLRWWRQAGRSPVSMVTLAYEGSAFVSRLARYEFADLRRLPYRDGWFTNALCISTLEHVGMDNSRYGAAAARGSDTNAAAREALGEIRRVTSTGGTLLLSVPFGRRSDRGWFRVFDSEDLQAVLSGSGWQVRSVQFYRSTVAGWRFCQEKDAFDAGYNEPAKRGGQRTSPAHVRAAEAVALAELAAS